MERVIRFRISDKLLRKFRAVCALLDISATRQTEELIRKFIEVQEQNGKIINEE